MSSMEEYLEKLRSCFEEEDLEGFYELREDLLEQLEVCLAEGQTEEEVVSKLSPPAEVANDYYADKSLYAAMHAETYVVPKEQVQGIFIASQKRKLKKVLSAFLHILYPLIVCILIGLLGFFLVYLIKEMVQDHHFGTIPFLSLLLILVLLLQLAKKWAGQKRGRLNRCSLFLVILLSGAGIFSIFTGRFFYLGENYYHEYQLTAEKNFSFDLASDADLEVTTVQVSASEKPSFIIKGHFKHSDIQKIEKADYQKGVQLSLDQYNLFDLFTKTGSSEVIFFIPKGRRLSDFNLNLVKGDLRLLDMKAEKLSVFMKTGDIYAKNVEVEDGKISSDAGDVVMENSKGKLGIDSLTGKTVLTGFTGDITIDSKQGVSILKELTANSVKIDNYDSRLALENSDIRNLEVHSESGQLVVKHTAGNLFLKNQSGKIVSEENRGTVKLENQSGPIIAIQNFPVNAEVSTDSGFIKWLQNGDAAIKVEANVSDGELRNEFIQTTKTEATVKINSITGNVKVLKKVE